MLLGQDLKALTNLDWNLQCGPRSMGFVYVCFNIIIVITIIKNQVGGNKISQISLYFFQKKLYREVKIPKKSLKLMI